MVEALLGGSSARWKLSEEGLCGRSSARRSPDLTYSAGIIQGVLKAACSSG